MTQPRGGREWVALVGLVLIASTLSVLSPGVMLAIPFALLALALPPRKTGVVVAGMALLAVIVSSRGADSLWYFERGWTLLLGSWFIVLVVLMPAAQFVSRAMGAVGATAATVGVFLAVQTNGFTRLDTAVTDRLQTAATAAAAAFTEVMKKKDGTSAFSSASVYRAAEMQAELFPAFLALASIAALGVGWWLFRRFAAEDRQPLRPLREFRFSDHLVWLLLIGAGLLMLPANELAQRAGLNLVTFMAALYTLRGIAVLVVIGGAPGPVGMVVGAVLFVLLYPLVMAATMVVGLTDTWLDIRAKRPIAPTPGS